MAISIPSGSHKYLCHSLADQLIQRGLFSSAQLVIQRMISHSMSVADAVSVANSAVGRGLDLDLNTYAVLIKKLVSLGEPQLAESLYLIEIESRGNNADPSILNSMVVCSCELGKVEDAINHFNRLLSLNFVPQKEACLGILQKCYAQERYLDAFDLFLRAQYAEAELSFECYSLLIDGLCHKGHLDEALQVFNLLQNYHKHLPTVHIYKSLFYGLYKGSRVSEAELIIGEMESQGIYIDKTMYTSLVRMYCRDKRMKVAMQVFFKMLKTGCQPDRSMCNILIDGFMKLSLYDKGWFMHDRMMEWGIKPDVVTYQVIMAQYCKEEKFDLALTLFYNMINSKVAPNVHCYTVLFSALYKHNKVEEFYELYKTMMESNVIPDHVLYLKLVKILPVCKLELAFTILQALAKNGCGIDLMLPASSSPNPDFDFEQEIELLLERIARKNINLTIVACSIYINALCEKGEIDKALVRLKKLDDAGYRPLHFCYNSLIKCLSKMGHFEDANFVIDLMEDRGLVPDQATFLIIINELCNQGDVVSAVNFLDQMEERGMKPSVAIYDSIIGCLVREGKITEAEDMFKRMLMCGVDPDEAVYTTMIYGYSMNGRILEARELFDKMIENSIKPSYRSYTILISGLVEKHMIEDGCIYLGKMLEDGMVPNAVLYTSLILHFMKNREFGVALKLVNLAGKNEVTWDLMMCMAFVNGVRRYISCKNNKDYNLPRKSEWGKEMLLYLLNWSPFPAIENSIRVPANSSDALKWLARKLIKVFKGAAITDNLYLNNCIISWLCREEMINDAYNHFQLMQKEGVCPNHVTYTILLHGYIQLDDIDSAVRCSTR
ncbi:pentatricopeptide repeat-containing protein At5g62370-like [Neltuma alba]|uniref:pentatricopeptide repeat-containing protein At5g62370-like n=1 Tax=Neltuma alba TaxID=207710 RepID=UPI0010A3A724|nr:pentatricopeptide repeat-containing protein At5g62370-like [Prosopis alba]